MDEMNKMNESIEKLKKENDLLRAMKEQAEKDKNSNKKKKNKNEKDHLTSVDRSESIGRKWGSFGVVLPSSPKHTISAHSVEGVCVRYVSIKGYKTSYTPNSNYLFG